MGATLAFVLSIRPGVRLATLDARSTWSTVRRTVPGAVSSKLSCSYKLIHMFYKRRERPLHALHVYRQSLGHDALPATADHPVNRASKGCPEQFELFYHVRTCSDLRSRKYGNISCMRYKSTASRWAGDARPVTADHPVNRASNGYREQAEVCCHARTYSYIRSSKYGSSGCIRHTSTASSFDCDARLASPQRPPVHHPLHTHCGPHSVSPSWTFKLTDVLHELSE